MSKKGIGPVPDALARLDEAGFLEQLRKLFLDVQAGRLDALAGRTVSGGSSGAPVPGPPGPPGPPAAPSSPDLTPPPTPSGVIVTAGINAVYITTDAPIFTQGHGYNRTIVYGAKYGGAGPLPTFSDAVVVHEFVGQVGSFPSDPGDQWHIWLKWRSDDQVESVSPSGGANGHQVTTGTDVSNLLDALSGSITASQLHASLNERIDLIEVSAGEVATLQAIVQTGGPNLVRNSSFEVDSNADGLADQWTWFTGGSGDTARTVSLSRPAALYGVGVCQRIQITGKTPGNTQDNGLEQRIDPVQGGLPYTLSAYVRTNAAAVFIAVRPYSSSGVGLGDVSSSMAPGDGTIARLVATGTLPANTAYVDVFVRGITAVGEYIEIDAVQFEQSGSVTGYNPGSGDTNLLSAAVQQEITTRATVDGYLGAQYTLRLDVGGRVVGFGISSTSAPGAGPTSDFQVVADRFSIAPPAGAEGVSPILPFVVQATPTTTPAGEVLPAGVYMNAAYIRNLETVLARFNTAIITNAMIQSVSASKIVAGSIAVGEYIQSSDFVSGSSGWRLGGNTAEIGAAHIRGQLTAAQIDSRNLTIRDGSGNVIFGASQNLDISRLQGGMKLFKATAWGRSAGSPTGNLIDGASGASLNGAGRSYIVNVIRRSDGVLLSSTVYDVWGSSANATAMATALNALTSTVVVVVRTYDEPRNNRLAGGLPDALYRCGANPAVFGTPDFKVGAAYILIGIPGCGPCNGYESYAGSIDDDPNALIEASFYLHNGNIITTGTSASPRFPITSANVSTFIANAAIGNAQIGGDIWSTNYVPGVSGWVIERGGYAEFENVKVRGDVQATSVNGAIVDTGHIVQNAVTTLGYTFSATTSTLNFAASTTLQRVDLISVTATSTGSPQQVIPGGFVTVGRDPPLTTTIQYALELWRDSTMLVDSLVFSGDFDYGAIHLHLPVYIDHPSAGSHTYTVRLRYLSLGSAQNMFVIRHVRALQILEVKR